MGSDDRQVTQPNRFAKLAPPRAVMADQEHLKTGAESEFVMGSDWYLQTASASEPNAASGIGQANRRGPLVPGDRVQITDPKGRMHTVVLIPGGRFQSSRGILNHDDVLGKPDGQVVPAGEGRTFQVIRPLLADYVLSMPRGAAIIYPKDAAQIIQMADIFPGAKVLESGVGSGALALSLLSAIGSEGLLHSVERRRDFAEIAKANVDLWFGQEHPAWTLEVADLKDALEHMEDGTYDRVVLDLLDPWSFSEEAARVLVPGGVFCAYVTTVPQMSRIVESLRETGRFTEPSAWDTTNRQWHVQGLAVRPDHRMIAHTGYLIFARSLAQGAVPLERAKHPAPAAEGSSGGWDEDQAWDEASLGQRRSSDRKVRRVKRDVTAKRDQWISTSQEPVKEDGDE